MAQSNGISIKKQYGQHFLRNHSTVEHMIEAVTITPSTRVLEIGCGDGFLTHAILETPIAQLDIYEIDPEWARYVLSRFADKRIVMHQQNILDVSSQELEAIAPFTILANLPYQITFPLLHLFQRNRAFITEGVIMIQEEVAQKLTKKSGRDFGYSSLFFQYYFELRLLDKVAPTSFFPPPKVYSRLLYLQPKKDVAPIPQEDEFWTFIKHVFKQPRRTLRNNIRQTHYKSELLSQEILDLRAQQLGIDKLLQLWDMLREKS